MQEIDEEKELKAPRCACCSHCEQEEETNKEKIRLIIGAIVFVAGTILSGFHIGQIFTFPIFVVSLLVSGGTVFLHAAGNIRHGKVFDENFLMSVASLGAFAIGQFQEGAAVMLFNQVGEYLQDLAEDRAESSVEELMDLRPDVAKRRTEKGMESVSPEEIQVGEWIEVAPGERIPLDGIVMEGDSQVDTSSLTGEPVPRTVRPGTEVSAGTINQSGLLVIRVERVYRESTVAHVLEIMHDASEKKAHTERFITKFSHYYTPVVTIGAILLACIPTLIFHQPFSVWIYRALLFLVVSCPCALVVSVPLGFFAGIGAASANGILVKGGGVLETLGRLYTVVFDKTGTLTKGVFEVTGLYPQKGVANEKLLATAAAVEAYSGHPIAKSIRQAAEEQNITLPVDHEIGKVEELAGLGVRMHMQGCEYLVGKRSLLETSGVQADLCSAVGTTVYVAENGQYLGVVVLSDVVKPDAKETVRKLHAMGISKTAMLTGDRKEIAERIAHTLGIDQVRAELMPDEKLSAFEKISAAEGTAAFIGDGVNDAPCLARADIGIAMGGIGSDAAVEAADVVIMDDRPARLPVLIQIARSVRQTVRANIIFAIGVKVIVMVLGALGYANIWAAVFADTGVAVLAAMNSVRILLQRNKYKI